MLNINIRPVHKEDAAELTAIRLMDGVQNNLLAIPGQRVESTENFLAQLTDQDHFLVAEISEKGGKTKLVGSASLSTERGARVRHRAELGIMVHQGYHNKGVGRKLMHSLLDIADNWLKLIRVELDVFEDNAPAIKLYQSLGFVIEGTRRYAAIKEGKYAHTLLMARYSIDA